MATKPVKRILDWASGGSVTDPGAGKEAAGWLTSERPPANWWNWILQSFGDWLSWSEDSIDDIETKTDFITITQNVNLDNLETSVNDNAVDIAALQDNGPVAVGRVETGSTATEEFSSGETIDTMTYSGDELLITFDNPVAASTSAAVVIVSGERTADTLNYKGWLSTTSVLRVAAVVPTTEASADLGFLVTRINFVIYGSPT